MSIWQTLLASGRRWFDLDADVPASGADGCAPDPNDVGFTAAVVGLGAKLAKADGVVSDAEVAMFSRVFRAAPSDADAVRRVFNLARQTVRGYESYARRIGKRYAGRPCLLEGVLDGLFHIAAADGHISDEELEFLETVSAAFGFSEDDFLRIKSTHTGSDPEDPYTILGVARDAPFSDIRLAYRRLMADHHPDRVIYKGAPREFEVAAHDKAAAINSAYARIRAARGMLVRAD